MNEEEKEDRLYRLALENMWRCDCADNMNHLEVDFHEFGCQYALWYARKRRELYEED